jgi:transcriptional regulator with AAA-type ATPase domain/tetratricopeptide (TPR) repeat protein
MDALDELLGESRKIVALRQKARVLLQHHGGARRPPPILIQGETGSGKGLLARLMHRSGPRASGPFVDLSCAAIPETLLEAELFGYERGAFTDARQSKPGLFHLAHGGTLFLDEIGLLARALQAKLLTALEQGSVRRLGGTRSEPANVSIIAATNESLLARVREGQFREDLYHRLAVLMLDLPSLRERREDIALLATRFVERLCEEYGMPVKSLSAEALRALSVYDWPGNVRELGNAIERAVLLSDTDVIGVDHLDLVGVAPAAPPAEPARTLSLPSPEVTNRERLLEALEQTGWNITRTAALLDITRNTVRARIHHYGLRQSGGAEPPPPVRPAVDASEPMMAPASERSERTGVTDVRWERRRVTFLRARIVAAPGALSSLTTRVMSRLVDKIQSFGGRVNEVSQQEVLAVFGHEPAEDAPRRAASVALAIAKAVHAERLDGRLSEDLAVAITIHVEQFVVARMPGGSVVDQAAAREASRILQTLDPEPGTIAVSDGAVGFLARYFDVQRAPDGRGHCLLGRWPAPGGANPVGFIGRQAEINLLRSLLDRAMSGLGQIVTIVGEPGIGKSRLLHEFRQSIARESVIVLEGRCASYGTHVPYFAALEVLQAVCGIEEADPVEIVDAKVLAALRPLGDSALASAPYLQNLLSPRKGGEMSNRSPDSVKAKTFDAIRQIVLAQQEHSTLVLVTEDLQWLDQSSEELLAELARAVAGSRVLLVTTSRPGYQPSWSAQANATQVALGPLSAAESRQLVESVLGERPPAEALITRIVGRGDGNPFFLEELARAVREQPEAPSHLPVPATVHDVLATRIDGLSDSDRQVLHFAAIIGRDVSVALLQEASGTAPASVRASLGRLQAADFLAAARFGVDAEYSFKHTLTHDVAYKQVPDDVRTALHGRVAGAIQKLAPETGERRPETLARHYTEAGRRADAINFWSRAGQLAIQRSAHADALVHFANALELLGEQPEGPERAAQEVRAQLGIATTLTTTLGYAAPGLEQTVERIGTLAGQLRDASQEFSVRWTLWRFHFARADFRRAEPLAGQLLALAQAQDDPLGRVGAHAAAGIDRFYLGEFGAAREHLTEALAAHSVAQSDAQRLRYGHDLGIAAAGFLGWTEAVTGDLGGAAERARRMLEAAQAVPHPFSVALALFLACEIHEQRRDPAAVRPLGEQLVAISREHSFRLFSAIGLMHCGWAEAADRDVHVGLAQMREGAELFRAVGQRVGLAHRARLAEGLLAVGAIDEALAVIAEAATHWRQTDEQAFVAMHLTLRGDALRRQGDLAGARRAFAEALDVAQRQGAWLFALRAACGLVRLDPAARETLAVIAERFPATLDSPDLRAARSLLEGQP